MSNKNIDLVKWAMETALKKGATHSATSLSNIREIDITRREGKLDKLSESTQNSLNIQIYVNSKYSSHSTNDIRKTSLDKFIEEAVVATKYLAEDKARLLPDPELYPKQLKKLEIFDSGYDEVKSSERVDIAAKIEETALKMSDKIISVSAGYGDAKRSVARVTNNGFEAYTEGTFFSANAEVTVRDGEKGRPEDSYYSASRFLEDMPNPEVIAKNAVERALRKTGQQKIDSGKYQMVVENRSVNRLLGTLLTPMDGSSLHRKTTWLDGMIGKQIASDKLTIIDDPTILRGIGSRNFDGEGLAGIKRVMIEKGILKNYYISNYYGKKLDMKPTTGSSSNLVFEYGKRSLEEMIKDVKKGIFVYDFIGGNSNPTTGDFSYGIAGMLIENGKLVQPVNEMNISGNAKEFWKKLLETGNDVYEYSSWRRPSMLFDDISFSGK